MKNGQNDNELASNDDAVNGVCNGIASTSLMDDEDKYNRKGLGTLRSLDHLQRKEQATSTEENEGNESDNDNRSSADDNYDQSTDDRTRRSLLMGDLSNEYVTYLCEKKKELQERSLKRYV